ncbi:MAG: hypothetical protein JXP34_25405 [Planctomycetes bacterium]|nr:hypothetical protein [Planctomycetota bacterium]
MESVRVRTACVAGVVSLVIAFGGTTARSQDCIDDGLIAWWTLDEEDIDGDMVIDIIGGNDGTISGVLDPTDGWCNGALYFDGTGSYVQLPAVGSFPQCTLECWAMTETLAPAYQGIVSTGDWAAGYIHFKFEASQIQIHKSDGVKITYPATAGEWYHIVYTIDTTLNEMKLYVNGEFIVSGTSGATAQNWNSLRIGSEYDGRYLTGVVDEVRLYERVLDEDEIREQFEMSEACLCKGCEPKACPCSVRAGWVGDAILVTWNPNQQPADSVDIVRNGTPIADDIPFSPPSYRDTTAEPGLLTYELTFSAPEVTCPVRSATYNACITDFAIAGCDPSGVTLTWTNNFVYAGIEVRRDDELLAALPGDATTYVDEDPPVGPWMYSVVPSTGSCDRATVEIEIFPEDDVPPWTSYDIGVTLCGGITMVDEDAYDLHGGGADIWGTADGFRFAHQEMEGDFEIVARIDDIVNTNAWAKAGLMARANDDPGSPYAFIFLTPYPGGNGFDFQYRATAAADALQIGQTGDGTFAFPYYLRLSRICGTFIGATSIDGVEWTDHGSQTIAMPDPILVGMALTSHDVGAVSTAEFREVAITSIDPCPTDISCALDAGTGAVTVTWSNPPGYTYARVRMYRRDPAGVESRIDSVTGSPEEYVDLKAKDLEPGTYAYRIGPVVGASECTGCLRSAEITLGAGALFHRGDVDGNGILTIGDAVTLLNYQFASGIVPPCIDACDMDDDEILTIGDAVWLLNYQFASGVPPLPPGPPPNPCGPDPAGDALDCAAYPPAACQ